MKKSNRQAIIKKLIIEHDIGTQEELLALLQAQAIQATQATVSRDIRELGIVKGHDAMGQVKYVILEQAPPVSEGRLAELVAETVEQVSQAQFMVVIQTYLGSANVLAAVIDEMALPEVAGTLAGANTLAIITHNNAEAQKISQLIESFKVN